MSRTLRTTAILMMASTAGALCVGLSSPASAHPVLDHPRPVQASPYATPLAALSGRCLAQYLADHQAGVLGAIGV